MNLVLMRSSFDADLSAETLRGRGGGPRLGRGAEGSWTGAVTRALVGVTLLIKT